MSNIYIFFFFFPTASFNEGQIKKKLKKNQNKTKKKQKPNKPTIHKIFLFNHLLGASENKYVILCIHGKVEKLLNGKKKQHHLLLQYKITYVFFN